MKKKKKKHSKIDLSSICQSFKHHSFLPHSEQSFFSNYTNSWFDLSSTQFTNNEIQSIQKSNLWKPKENSSLVSYSRKYRFFPTNEQHKILDSWFFDSTFIYNKTLKLLKSKMYCKTNDKPSFISIRNELKGVIPGEGKKKREKLTLSDIPVHVLDCSIKQAVENYKSALENWRQKNWKHYRIRYEPYHKKVNKILHIEPACFNKNGHITRLGKCNLMDIETNKPFELIKENIQREVKIQWNKLDHCYYFILSYVKPVKQNESLKEEFISLDPGVSPFLSGVSKTNGYIIGKEHYHKLKNQYGKIDKCESSNISIKKKRKHNERIRRKIKNQIDDMHWKTICWITSKFHNVLIGDMSAKGVVEGDDIQKMSKRILHAQRLYQFKQRLQYKCKERNVNYYEVNEYMTSKTCSCCGEIKEDLGFNKEYICNKCGIKMHRDLNGARCIYNVWKLHQKK